MHVLIVQACQRRLIDQHNERAWLAWHVAAMQQMKKLPKLSSLQRRYPTKPQTPDQMHRAAQLIANTFKARS